MSELVERIVSKAEHISISVLGNKYSTSTIPDLVDSFSFKIKGGILKIGKVKEGTLASIELSASLTEPELQLLHTKIKEKYEKQKKEIDEQEKQEARDRLKEILK